MLSFTSVILLLFSMGLLRYLKVIEFVYSVGIEQLVSENKKYCICLKIAWEFIFTFYVFINDQKLIH